MSYKLTFHAPEPHLQRLKDKGRYPFMYGGIAWEEGMSKTVTDLSPFYEGERAKKHVHDFLIVEETTDEEYLEDSTETN